MESQPTGQQPLSIPAAVKEMVLQDHRASAVVTDSGTYKAESIILATGGKAYPGTGSTGDGYAFG